jgi:hypothetical protein
MKKSGHQHGENVRLEKMGFYLSVLCAVHCIAMPLIITLLPFMGSSFLNDHSWELFLIGLSMLLGVWVLWSDYQKHQIRLPLLLLVGSFLIKLIELAYLSHHYEYLTAPIGAILIAAAYYLNWKHKEACSC